MAQPNGNLPPITDTDRIIAALAQMETRFIDQLQGVEKRLTKNTTL